jgi:hypothetical protein
LDRQASVSPTRRIANAVAIALFYAVGWLLLVSAALIGADGEQFVIRVAVPADWYVRKL